MRRAGHRRSTRRRSDDPDSGGRSFLPVRLVVGATVGLPAHADHRGTLVCTWGPIGGMVDVGSGIGRALCTILPAMKSEVVGRQSRAGAPADIAGGSRASNVGPVLSRGTRHSGVMHTNPVAAALASVLLGPEVVVDNLTMIPLLFKEALKSEPRSPGSDYLLLDEALAGGFVEITEVSEQGSVPELKFLNRGAKPVLIVDGEELLGAKQNRVVNLTILVAANSELTIPVSCVEAGRWRSRSRMFTSAPRTQFATGRAKRMASVSMSMIARGDRTSDQAEVWDDIALKSRRMNASSPTAAMESIFSTHADSLESFVSRCTPVDGQVGALFAVNGVIVGFDLFDQPSTLRKMLPKLVRSVAVDALDGAPVASDAILRSDAALMRVQAGQFLAVAAEAAQHRTAALGLGEDLRLAARHIAGGALTVADAVVHASAFAL